MTGLPSGDLLQAIIKRFPRVVEIGVRLRLAWYLLRGDSIAYRLTIRDGGIDMTANPRGHIHEVQIYGADTALRVTGSALSTEVYLNE